MSVALPTQPQKGNYRLHQLQKEKELLCKVRLGDFDGARACLEEISAEIFRIGPNNIGVIKVRVLELMLVLSRAIVDGGADYDKVSSINNKLITDIAFQKALGGISLTLRQALEAYIKCRPASYSKHGEVVKRAKEFIMNNYHQQLTLEQIARSVHMSPYYFSHIFKDTEGISVIEYVTKVRIERAKFLLLDPNVTICEISENLGYKEPGYFTKVFRKVVGQTPSQFRKSG